MADARRPLDGVRVVGIIIAQQGTVGFTMMGDLGAEVIKIEPPGTGDPSRGLSRPRNQDLPLGKNTYFETNDRSFKSVTLNFQEEKGREILYKLVKDADIFAQNLRPGVAKRRGFAYEDLIKVNPNIVYINMSAYGPDGPNANLPGNDGIGQAAGGTASIYGDPDRRMMTGTHSVADETGAFMAFQAAMVGLYHLKMTGEGQKIDTSLLGGQIRLMGNAMSRVLMSGKNLIRGRARSLGNGPGVTAGFDDKDGKPFQIQMHGEERWQKAMAACGFDKALAESGCAKLGEIKTEEDKKLFLDTMDKLFATNTREHWLKILRDNDIICAPIQTLLEASQDPDVIANGYVVEVDHPKIGKIKEVGFPWKFHKTPARAGLAPELGEHNDEIYKGRLGYSGEELEQLKKEGVI